MKKFMLPELSELYDQAMSCIEKANEIEDKELRLELLKLSLVTVFTTFKIHLN